MIVRKSSFFNLMMKPFEFSLAFAFVLVIASSSVAFADVVEYTWNVENFSIERLCDQHVITGINGSLPGPSINVREGDTLVVHVLNNSPYNMTIHWHGIFQFLSPWSDGPEFVTQCPIPPGGSYTYQFNISGQEGTLWYHGHSSFLRATVHGSLIIRPRQGNSYPFSFDEEATILLGEWWNANVVDVENNATLTGAAPTDSDAYTINGLPGDLYNCSQNQTYQLNVTQGKTYLLRIINAALNEQHFFKIANHTFTVVAVDAAYTQQYTTDVIVLAPGQTVDALVTTNQTTVGSYYMAFTPYRSSNVVINNSTTRAILTYNDATSSSNSSTPIMPDLPDAFDTPTAFKFYSNLTGLVNGPHWAPVPRVVDEDMFITFGINLDQCNLPGPNNTCGGPLNLRLSASMNNESFVIPANKGLSMLEALYSNTSGVYTRDFPSQPPLVYNYTSSDLGLSLAFAPKSTKVYPLKFNSTVQIVLQNNAILAAENHPIHLHGFNFHVLAQGFGNYDKTQDEAKFNLDNPQIRNTIAVPTDGWAVIRFVANNPGIWFMHCHLDNHLTWGLGMCFEVENGPSTILPSPPSDLPKC